MGISKNSILTFSPDSNRERRTKVQVEKEGFLEMPIIPFGAHYFNFIRTGSPEGN